MLTNEVRKVCQKNKIDIIYGWWPVAFWASILSRTPYVVDMPEFLEIMYEAFRKPLPFLMKPILKTFQTIVAKKSRAVITESQRAIEEWVNRGVNRNKIYCAPYGIEIEIFNKKSNKTRNKLGIPKNDKMIMFHGDISFDDGIDILLDAVKDLDVWCVIVGDGPPEYVNYLKTLASKKTIFTGWVNYSEIPDYLASSDVYVAPFRSSNYTNTTHPLKQMEAMAAGKPVICSKIKAFSEAVTDRKDIILVEPGNSQILKETIRSVLKDKKMQDLLSKNAIKTAKEKFSWQKRVKVDEEMIKKAYKQSQSP